MSDDSSVGSTLRTRDVRATTSPVEVLVVEPNPDHGELIAELVQEASPAARVRLTGGRDAEPTPEPADLVVLSLASDPTTVRPWPADERWRQRPWRLLAVRDVQERWTASEVETLRPLELVESKEDATLQAALARALRAAPAAPAERAEGGEAPPPAAAAACGEELPQSTAPRPGATADARPGEAGPPPPPAKAPSRAPGTEGRAERHLLAAGILANQIGEMLGALEPLGALFRHRVPGDPVIERYVECLGGELRRAQAAASQVASLARHQDLDPTPRLVELASVMQLRVPAWRGWLPSDASLELREEPGTPPVEVWPELLGPAVDELVAAMVRRVPAKPALRLSVGPLRVARSTSGLGAELGARAGACARLVLAVAPAPSADAAGGDDEERAIERASIVARAHGGALQVSERRVGDGLESLVEIVLPRGDGRRLHARSGEEPARSRSLLVVDDEQEIRAIAREMLEFRGHRVHGASSGEEAIELFEAGCRYDLVLLDRQMGGLDGRETFHRLKGIDPDARVVLVSGSATTADLRKLLGEGMLGYLAKPFSMKDLVSTVESALRS